MIDNDFPQEHYIELTGLSPHFVGRIVIFKQEELFNVEIDIVQNESGKIYNHVKSLYQQPEPREALDTAVQHLKNYLQSKLH